MCIYAVVYKGDLFASYSCWLQRGNFCCIYSLETSCRYWYYMWVDRSQVMEYKKNKLEGLGLWGIAVSQRA